MWSTVREAKISLSSLYLWLWLWHTIPKGARIEVVNSRLFPNFLCITFFLNMLFRCPVTFFCNSRFLFSLLSLEYTLSYVTLTLLITNSHRGASYLPWFFLVFGNLLIMCHGMTFGLTVLEGL
jgi:hypothetical protein